MTRKIASTATLLNVVLVVIILLAVGYNLRNILFPIHVVRSVEILTPKVHVGGRVRYNLTVYRRELCDPKVYRFVYRVIDDNQRELVQTITFVGSAGGLGTATYESGFDLDPQLKPGHYKTSGFVVNLCHGLNRHEVQIPLSRFEIIP